MNKIKVISREKKDIELDCTEWAKEIGHNYKPDLIVFIAKSGFLFAKPLVEYFDIPMVDISISRSGNHGKDTIRKWIPRIPRWLLSLLLSCKANYGYQEKNNKRDVIISERFKSLDWKCYKKILIVDDSTDTGWSLLEAKRVVKQYSKDSEIKTLSYCVIDISKKRVNVDFFRYKNMIVVSATSRYSKENGEFLKSLESWQKDNTNQESARQKGI